MPNALKIINKEVNRLAKRFPNKKRKTLQKEAGKKYRDGKLKARRPKAKKKVVKKVRKTPRRKVGTVGRVKKATRRRSPVRTVTKTRTRLKTVYKTRRVGGSGKKEKGLLLLGLLALGVFLLPKLLKPSTPPLVITANPARNTTAQNILAYAAAAGATAAAIAKLIAQINASNDSQVSSLQSAIQAAPDLSDDSRVNQILQQNGGLAGYRLN